MTSVGLTVGRERREAAHKGCTVAAMVEALLRLPQDARMVEVGPDHSYLPLVAPAGTTRAILEGTGAGQISECYDNAGGSYEIVCINGG